MHGVFSHQSVVLGFDAYRVQRAGHSQVGDKRIDNIGCALSGFTETGD
jgi:hypothetical protein